MSTVLYIPVFKMACNYSVSFGRRWSIIEHLLLVEVSRKRRTLDELCLLATLPPRLVIEALGNLLRAGWIEVRSSDDAIVFRATPSGKRRADETALPVQVHSAIKWASFCVDRVTGAWLRTDDLDIVYASDLPQDARVLTPTLQSFESRDLPRDLLYLRQDEALDPSEPRFRTPSRPYARVSVAFGVVEGLPGYAPLDLRAKLLEEALDDELIPPPAATAAELMSASLDFKDTLAPDDFIVGGPEHRELIEAALDRAQSSVIIHSCFLHPAVVESLLPAFERAARRKVRVELLWGLVYDPENLEQRRAITDSERALSNLPAALRSRVQLSSISSRSHAKAIIYDERPEGGWKAIVGSCNFLSSWYDALDVSVRIHNPELISQLLGRLISTQQPASGDWPPMTVRLNRIWDQVKKSVPKWTSEGSFNLRLVADTEHHVCVTDARDLAIGSPDAVRLTVACDLFGLSAETSVLTPMTTAAAAGNPVELLFQRPSKFLQEQGRRPEPENAETRGLKLTEVPKLHGKVLLAGPDTVVVTSFNWMSTALDGIRSRNAEFGIRVRAPGVADRLRERLGEIAPQFSAPLEVLPVQDDWLSPDRRSRPTEPS